MQEELYIIIVSHEEKILAKAWREMKKKIFVVFHNLKYIDGKIWNIQPTSHGTIFRLRFSAVSLNQTPKDKGNHVE